MAEVLPKVRLARDHVHSGHLRLFVEVDGGIDDGHHRGGGRGRRRRVRRGLGGLSAPTIPPQRSSALRAPPALRCGAERCQLRFPSSNRPRCTARLPSARPCAAAPARTRRSARDPRRDGAARRRGRDRASRRPARRGRRSAGGRDGGQGGTAVVTLEPCGHTGRTRPCADALIEAGIARVIYAVDDPEPDRGRWRRATARGRRRGRRRGRGARGESGGAAAVAARGANRPARSSPGSSPPRSTAGSPPPT